MHRQILKNTRRLYKHMVSFVASRKSTNSDKYINAETKIPKGGKIMNRYYEKPHFFDCLDLDQIWQNPFEDKYKEKEQENEIRRFSMPGFVLTYY